MPFDDGKNRINKDNAYEILKAFAKEYRKQNGETPAEIIIVGGGSIMLNYGFRDYTQEFDIMISTVSAEVKGIILRIAEQYNLPNDWMNTDFKKTVSYSEKLREVSVHQFSFNHNSLEFRTVRDEYLIAMKMIAARGYRNDVSDIIGILAYSKKDGFDISYSTIEDAIIYLYGDVNTISQDIKDRVKELTTFDYNLLLSEYEKCKDEENQTRDDIIDIDKKYKGIVNEQSMDDIVATIRKKHSGR